MKVTVVHDHTELVEHVPAWNDLAANALEPNAFYEPWTLLPGVQSFGAGKDLLFLLIYRTNPQQPRETPLLCGLFPLERRRKYRGLPVSYLALWEYGNCFLQTPLVRKGYGRECLSALFDWLASDRESAALIGFEQIAGDGPFYQHLIEEFRARGTLSFIADSFTRAFLRRAADGEAYIQQALSSNKRRDLQRKQRRLTEQGRLDFVRLEKAADLEHWLAEFLRLEGCGWKAEEGTALACREPDKAFFLNAARQGFDLKKLWMLGLTLNDRLIAVRCNFISRPGSFFYKPGYDETLSKFSPGVLLELENIRQLHADPTIQWMDSCTSPENGLLNNLWLDRRIILSVVASTGRGLGNLALSSLPFFRWVNRLLGRYQPPPKP